MGDIADGADRERRDTSDLQRVERLFNKALWAVGAMGVVAIGSGAAAMLSFNSLVSDATDRAAERIKEISEEAQSRIGEISETAETRIREQAEKVGANLEERLMSDINVGTVVANAEQAVRRDMLAKVGEESGEIMRRLQERETTVLEEIGDLRSDAQAQLNRVQQAVADYQNSVDQARAGLEQLVSLQDIASKMKVEIRDIKVPFKSAIGEPAVVTAEYQVEGVEAKSKVTFDVRFLSFGQIWTVQDTALIPMVSYGDTAKVSKTLLVPEKDEETGIGFGPGDYAIKVEVWFGDTLLAQKSETWSITKGAE